jgi:predicted ATPase/tetratricopeptide (TPR) repeat protein
LRRRYTTQHAAVVAQHGGQVIVPTGERGLSAALFVRASDALAAACALQVMCRAEGAAAMPVGMALHTGESVARMREAATDMRRLYAPVLAHGERLAAAAHVGQIVLTLNARVLVRHNLPPGVRLRPLGAYTLPSQTRPEALFQVVHPALAATFPPLKATPANPTNLPAALTSFIGRTQELEAVRRLVLGASSSRARLVTLSGAGGCGKTRLALQVATALLNEAPADLCPDGIWLVELGALQDGELVVRAIATALGLREEPGRSALEQLREHLREKALLLVLDNCEHLLAASAAVADTLLCSCARLQLLATSREPLGIAGEAVYRVPSLSLAASAAGTGEALQGEAVQLFLERARACQPDLALTDRSAPLVERICRRLDGMPLAIELAAARLDVLSLESIDARLDDRFRLLTAGRRTALPRQQTLRATMEWSYSLLSEAERTLLRRLAVFAGGWMLEAAETVCAEGVASDAALAPIADIERGDVLDLLSQLCAKSLVFVDLQDGLARYGMLETVRHYAREQLAAGGKSALLRERHYQYYLALAQRAETALGGPMQGAWSTSLEREHDNVRAALQWCRIEPAEPAPTPSYGQERVERDRRAASFRRADAAMELAATLAWFWEVHGHWAEGRRYLDDALVDAGAEVPPRLRLSALNWAGRLALRQADFPRATACYEQGAVMARQLCDRSGLATALNGLGNMALRQSDFLRATCCFEEALGIRRDMRDKRGTAAILNNLGLVAHNQGKLERAQVLHEESLGLVRELGNKAGISASLNNLAIVAWLQGEHARAVSLHEEGMALRRELGDKSGLASELDALALVLQSQGDLDRAATLHAQSLALRQELGDRWGMATSYHGLGRLAFVRREFGVAATNYARSLAVTLELKDRLSIADTLVDVAMLAVALEQAARAVTLCSASDLLMRDIGAAMPPELSDRFVQARTAAQACLGDEAFARAWDDGRRLALDQAVALALELARDRDTPGST